MSTRESGTARRVLRKMTVGVIAALAAMCLMVPAIAFGALTDTPPTGTLNVTGVTQGVDESNTLRDGDTVNFYKVVDTTYNNGAVSSQFAEGFKDADANSFTYTNAAGESVTVTWDQYVAAAENAETAKAMAEQVSIAAKQKGLTPETVTVTGGKAAFTGELGQYLITVTPGADNPDGLIWQTTLQSIVPVKDGSSYTLPDQDIQVKSTPMTLDKKAQKLSGTWTSEDPEFVSDRKVGDTVPYEIEVTIPTYPANATDKTFIVGDSMEAGLKYDHDGVVHISTDDGTPITPLSSVTKNVTWDESGFEIEFDYDLLVAKTGAANKLVITYTATITDAAVQLDPKTNTATVEYATHPYDENSHKTKEDKTDQIDFGVEVVKVDKADNSKKLQGAQFVLAKGNTFLGTKTEGEGEDAVTLPDWVSEQSKATVFTTDSEGKFNITGLGEGSYTLIEIQGPTGYENNRGKEFAFNVTLDKVETDESGVTTYKLKSDADEDGLVEVTAENEQNNGLPVTGGMGTTILTTVGVLLVAGAVVIILRSRKKQVQ